VLPVRFVAPYYFSRLWRVFLKISVISFGRRIHVGTKITLFGDYLLC
jgi:hypothetical protein